MTLELETTKVLNALAAIVAVKSVSGFASVDFSIEACEAAAEIAQCDVTFCKMLNRSFRENAAALMMGRT